MSEVETMFHEFGHVLHSVFSRTRYQSLSGTRTQTDFVEVPSHLFEHFAWDWRVARRWARHHETGEPIPEPLMRALRGSRRMFSGFETQSQVSYALFDQWLHGGQPRRDPLESLALDALEPLASAAGGATGREARNRAREATGREAGQLLDLGDGGWDSTSGFRRLFWRTTGLVQPRGAHWQSQFGHLVGYGGGYYTYLLAQAVAAAIWRAHFERDPLCPRAGETLRREMLSTGNARPPEDIIAALLGEEARGGIDWSGIVASWLEDTAFDWNAHDRLEQGGRN
jgi:intermediate peptidase